MERKVAGIETWCSRARQPRNDRNRRSWLCQIDPQHRTWESGQSGLPEACEAVDAWSVDGASSTGSGGTA